MTSQVKTLIDVTAKYIIDADRKELERLKEEIKRLEKHIYTLEGVAYGTDN